MIEIQGLHKRYDDLIALRGLDLSVEPGEVFGFLGPNGSGKTTTIKMLVGLLVPDAGGAKIAGMDIATQSIEVKRVLGFVPDSPMHYDYLTAREQLRFLADVRGLGDVDARIGQLLEQFSLAEKADTYCTDLSHGMRKKLAFAGALLHEPKVLILDEPTGGLDPLSVRRFRELVRSLADQGTTVFLSTHLLDIAARLCDRVGILYQGALRAVGAPDELVARRGEGELEDIFLEMTGTEDGSEGEGEIEASTATAAAPGTATEPEPKPTPEAGP